MIEIPFKQRSNLFFFVPLYVAYIQQDILHTGILSIVIIVSVLYHYYDETKFILLDELVARALIIYNIYILIYTWERSMVYIWIIAAFILFALYMYKRAQKENYNVYHGIWHICAAAITTLCILSI